MVKGVLFPGDVAFLVDACLAMGNVLKGELAYLLGDAMGAVTTGTNTFLLDERVDAAAEETALAVGLYLNDGGIAGDALEVHAVGGAEVAEAVGNEASLVDLGGADDVWAVAIDDVGTVVDAEMGEPAQVAALLVEENLHRVGQVAAGGTLGTAVERDDDDVGATDEVVDDAADGSHLAVCVHQGVGVMPEGAEPYLQSLALNDGCLYAPLQSGILDALLLQDVLGRDDALLAEVVGVVVGHAQEVVAGILQPVAVGRGGAEGVGVGTLLGALAAVADGSLEVAYGEVGPLQDGLDVVEEVGAVVGWQHDSGVGGTHHDVAGHGDGEGVG